MHYYNNNELNIEQLTNNADQALYKAKDKGRNRVEIFSPKQSLKG
ncbi:diguanylate cyclase domain-containing protein [Colwellia sp. C1TZA3]|nr:GGDEF domain-containing protein [Colwellia sp. C1TZA3]